MIVVLCGVCECQKVCLAATHPLTNHVSAPFLENIEIKRFEKGVSNT